MKYTYKREGAVMAIGVGSFFSRWWNDITVDQAHEPLWLRVAKPVGYVWSTEHIVTATERRDLGTLGITETRDVIRSINPWRVADLLNWPLIAVGGVKQLV